FWQTFHSGAYEKIPDALTALKGAYLQNPNDATTAAHIGFMHMWRLAENGRLSTRSPDITDNATLAHKYFQEAHALRPDDARFTGFLASSTLAEGGIHQDEKLTRQGYYLLKEAVAAWPEFNLFTAGYVMSSKPFDSPQFKEGLAQMWQNMEACQGAPVDRQRPSYRPVAEKIADEKTQHACGNSWITPHNMEGFFLNMGDMLVKAGDWQTAKNVYREAQAQPTYAKWPYASILEKRIEQAEQNVAIFRQVPSSTDKISPRMMNQSTFACMACHQN
ncbi:MAG: hypothetical protein KGM99_19320, partial [Burkholderiales bacterium]|nr:hypothetical protein [Burkholderiales bacterium]